MKLKNGYKTIELKDYQKTSPQRLQTSAKWRQATLILTLEKRKDKTINS